MKKEQLIELTTEYLSGGNAPVEVRGKYHPQNVEKFLEMVYGDIIYMAHSDGVKKNDVSALDEYVKTFTTVDVLYDSAREEYYSVLPCSIISLPKNRGIRLVSPQKEQGAKYWMTDNNSNSVYDELEVRTVLNKTKFYLEANKIYYINIPITQKTVLMKLVVPFGEFDEDDEINISSQGMSQVFTMVVKLLMQQPHEHKQTNNTSTLIK